MIGERSLGYYQALRDKYLNFFLNELGVKGIKYCQQVAKDA